jgi:hypothetical protein
MVAFWRRAGGASAAEPSSVAEAVRVPMDRALDPSEKEMFPDPYTVAVERPASGFTSTKCIEGISGIFRMRRRYVIVTAEY